MHLSQVSNVAWDMCPRELKFFFYYRREKVHKVLHKSRAQKLTAKYAKLS